MMAEYFERAIAPWWPEIRAALEDDILHRARRLTAGGAIEVFEDLHHQVHWRDGALEIDRPYEQRGRPGRPRAAARPRRLRVAAGLRDVRRAVAAGAHLHPARAGLAVGPGRDGGGDGEALAALLGRRRAAILATLGTPGGDERPGAAPRRLGGRRQRAPGRPAARRARARGARRAARPLLAHAHAATRSCAAPEARGLRAVGGLEHDRAVAEEELVAGRHARAADAPPHEPVPLLDPRSTASHAPSSARSSRCWRETVGWGMTTSQPRLRPTTIVPAAGSARGARGRVRDRAPARPRPPLARHVGDQHAQLGERPRAQHAPQAVLEGVDAQVALDAARPQQGDGPLAIAVGGAHHVRDAPPRGRSRQGRQRWISHSYGTSTGPSGARARTRASSGCAGRVVEGGDEARRADAVGEAVGVEALGEVEVALGQLAAGEGVAPGAAGVGGRVAAIRARSSR